MNLYYGNIVEKNLIEKLDQKEVHDFVSIDTGRTKDYDVLNKWKDDFKSRNIPFVITKDEKNINQNGTKIDEIWLTLWTELVVPPMPNPSNPRVEIIFDSANC